MIFRVAVSAKRGLIVNDDVQIQITNIRTNLPEGTAPIASGDLAGDVNPSIPGVQHYIEHSITFERQGDPRQAVWFTWRIELGTNQLIDTNAVVVVDGQPQIVNGEYLRRNFLWNWHKK